MLLETGCIIQLAVFEWIRCSFVHIVHHGHSTAYL